MRFWYLYIIFLFCTQSIFSQSSSDILSYILQYKQIALEQERKYGIPAPITLAQGILESGAGKSALTRNANNHFGVKAFGGWTGPVYLAWDDEVKKSRFRKYAKAEDSFRDHSLVLINGSRYSSLFTKSIYDYRAWAIGLQNAGYATASNYAKALIGYIDTYKLYNINGGAKLRAGKKVIITRMITTTQPEFEDSCIINDEEESEEEKEVTSVTRRFVVQINGVRCTLLYPGQSLISIALKYDISLSKILSYNEITDPKSLKEGDVVFLEKKKKEFTGVQDYYRVKKGDTMYSISQDFGIRLASLEKMNSKSIFDHLKEGERLSLKK